MSEFDDEIYVVWNLVNGFSKDASLFEDANLSKLNRLMLVDWCDLPDILYSEGGRNFIGLSFAVTYHFESFVKRIVDLTSNKRIRFVCASDNNFSIYEGFGCRDRLEIYWDEVDDVVCELASLDSGAWLFSSTSINNSDREIPCGYNLMSIKEIKNAYGLV